MKIFMLALFFEEEHKAHMLWNERNSFRSRSARGFSVLAPWVYTITCEDKRDNSADSC